MKRGWRSFPNRNVDHYWPGNAQLLGDFENYEYKALCGRVAYGTKDSEPRLDDGSRPCATCYRLYIECENGERPRHLLRWIGDLTKFGYPTRLQLLMRRD